MRRAALVAVLAVGLAGAVAVPSLTRRLRPTVPTPHAAATPACDVPGAEFVRYVETRGTPSDLCPFFGECGAEEYGAIPGRFPEWALPGDAVDLAVELDALEDGRIPLLPPEHDPERLDRLLQAASGLDVLLLGLGTRSLEIQVLEETVDGPWRGAPVAIPVQRIRQLLVTDPIVGNFEVVVYLPLSARERHRPVVFAHGHRDTGWIGMQATELAEELTGAGFAVVAPTFRANTGDVSETQATRALLQGGFSLMAVRIYEQILARRVAASLPEVDPCAPVALVGHSGGSVAGNITAHLDLDGFGFDAFVSDLQSIYANRDPTADTTLDETAPELYVLQRSINEVEPRVPTLRVPYDYPDGFAEIVAFLDAVVRLPPRPR